jgi:hypothetical protein
MNSEKNIDENCNGEEYRGSQNKKKRMQKGKTTPLTRTAKKVRLKSAVI